jgi:hypothetical protein
MKTQAFVVFGAVLGLVVGCGGSADSSTQAPAPAATDNPPAEQPPADPVAPPLDHGAPSETYPAFKPEIGQLVNNGGHVMKNPVIVTVTWSGETNADTFEKFGDELGPSDYWKAVTSEYGIGAGTSGAANHVRMTDTPPSTLSDTDIPTLVAQKIQATDATAWPQPTTDDFVYILYIPNATTFKLQGKEVCSQGVGGYHDSTKVGGKEVAYAVIPQCGGLDESTLSASHELAEAATDPHPQSLPGYVGFDEDHLSWEFFQQFQSENGDACEFYRDSSLAEPTLGFTVQRQWSNAAAAAGHNPCVPSATGVKYFNVSPLKQEDIELDLSQLGGDVQPTKGYKIKVGETKQIPLGLYSDGPTGAWQISAQSGGMFGHSSGSVDLTLDVEQGQNGQIAYLTATVNTQGRTKAELITIVSKSGSQTHYQPILIGSPDK